MQMMLLPSIVLLGVAALVRAESCAEKEDLLTKVQGGSITDADFKAFVDCLKTTKSDIEPEVLQVLSKMAKDKGIAEEAPDSCEDLVKTDGCNLDYSEEEKAVTGLDAKLKSGELCVKTCADKGGENTCAEEFDVLAKLEAGKLEGSDFQAFVGCLKSKKADMSPALVQYVSQANKEKGTGEIVSDSCEALIKVDGCNLDYSDSLKAMTGLDSELRSGDLCVKTCADEEELGEEEETCAEKVDLLTKLQSGNIEGADFQTFVGCLKSEKADVDPAVVQYLTEAAKEKDPSTIVSDSCEAMVKEDGCNLDFSDNVKALTGLDAALRSGDLCVRTCSSDDTEVKSLKSLGSTQEGKSCAEESDLLSKLQSGKMEDSAFKTFVSCLASKKSDLEPAVLLTLTQAAKEKGTAESTAGSCEDLVKKDGCNVDYSEDVKALIGLDAALKSGDLCAKTCADEIGEVTCDEKIDLLTKLQSKELEESDFQTFFACLKEKKADVEPEVLQFLSEQSERTPRDSCEALVEMDGCNLDYSEDVKALTGFDASLRSGDLCAKTCADETGEETCAEKIDLLTKLQSKELEESDFQTFFACLKEKKADVEPDVLQFLSEQSERTPRDSCEDLVKMDGCNLDYSEDVKGLTGFDAPLRSGDLCAKSCATEDDAEEGDAEDADQEGGDPAEEVVEEYQADQEGGDSAEDYVEEYQQLRGALPIAKVSAPFVCASLAMVAAAVIVAGFIARRRQPSNLFLPLAETRDDFGDDVCLE